MNFCPKCKILMEITTTSDSMLLTCPVCETKEEITENTTIKKSLMSSDFFDIRNILHNLFNDPTLPRMKKKCFNKKCDGTVLSYIRDKKTQAISYYICDKCRKCFKQTYSSDD